MSRESDDEADVLENFTEVFDELSKELRELYSFRDLFYENHPIEMATERNKMVEEKKNILAEKFQKIDVDKQVPLAHRAQFLYLKGRCLNINPSYDPCASQCLSKAVKLNPKIVDAWIDLGDCYWKNMNIKEAKASFEGALKQEPNPVALRCLSIIHRQESGGKVGEEATEVLMKSVKMAKDAVALDIKDGISWTVLGNAYLCQFFTVRQSPWALRQCMSAYKQAWLDPVARGHPDLYYNKGIAQKYEEEYAEAIENFKHSCLLDPSWEPPKQELARVTRYLASTDDLIRTKGKIKVKKLAQMVQNIDLKMLGVYTPGSLHRFADRADVSLELRTLDRLRVGMNEGTVILAKVVGSIHSDTAVPFSFAIVDASLTCMLVTVYNWADGRGAIIGDCVSLPEPMVTHHKSDKGPVKYDFKSIRVNNPMVIMLNGKRVGPNQFACTKVTSTYEIH